MLDSAVYAQITTCYIIFIGILKIADTCFYVIEKFIVSQNIN